MSIIDLLTGIAAGVGAIGLPLLGMILGWLAGKRHAPRTASLMAVAANAAALAVSLVASFVFGGS